MKLTKNVIQDQRGGKSYIGESRKVAEFSFMKLSGLKAMIEQHAK